MLVLFKSLALLSILLIIDIVVPEADIVYGFDVIYLIYRITTKVVSNTRLMKVYFG
jgi:hypothetical protein